MSNTTVEFLHALKNKDKKSAKDLLKKVLKERVKERINRVLEDRETPN